MKKIAIVGSRFMSDYGKKVIEKITKELVDVEVVTIKVMGCNGEVIRKCRERNLKCKVFEGENFEKLNEEVANYADFLVIIEGGKKSGTILLAEKFIEKGKNVYCVPGRIIDENSFASNWLIKQGAIPLIEVEDLTLLRPN